MTHHPYIERIAEGLRWRGEVLKDRGVGRSRAGRWLVDSLLLPSDIQRIRRTYRDEFGVAPHLLLPRTFNEKLQHSKIFTRRPRYTLFADKIDVREFVKKRVGAGFVNELLWTGLDLIEARTHDLPNQFVIKANQGSGTNLIVRDASILDWAVAQRKAAEWLKRSHAVYFVEWQYRWIEPRLLIEPLLRGPDGDVPLDYKFFCFHGRVEFVQVDVGRFTFHTRAIFDRSFFRLPVGLKYPSCQGALSRPKCFSQMIEMAETLSHGEAFMRVDLYDCGRPVFGELTLHPGAGLEHFDPPDWDLRFGSYW